ncbi:MAG: hypothetical protein M3T96_04190, partial [Acidobacteriota bacterium]|nr:hypothetical protein [Acidobacteriota bacterium]
SSNGSETRPPTEREVKDTFVRFFNNPEVTFENVQITSTVKSYTSSLGVDVHGYPVKITSVVMGGYGVKNGTRTSGVYYFYHDEFGEWQILQGDSITGTEF